MSLMTATIRQGLRPPLVIAAKVLPYNLAGKPFWRVGSLTVEEAHCLPAQVNPNVSFG